ncbi:HAMP domain-containing histidine kinase [Paenibacillus tritici]|uniref:histidine kinase n=1 Tax=Paenibacillus tritici TaxID=1873425 RepID=A0ABX2DQ13_9BACL|nr:HAMP domain-containing sensor histidine kinase [Paenibacillus tritici]NQX46722.1 HAMP domain-containing histidine kinase [Paenibacillus tritici]
MKGAGRFQLLHRSLLFRYLLILVAALLFIPVIVPLTIMLYSIFGGLAHEAPPKEYALYSSVDKLEIMWHEEARKLLDQPPEDITQRLRTLSETYHHARIFWVDHEGRTQLVTEPSGPPLLLDGQAARDIPAYWGAAEAVSFMKDSTALKPLAIVAFVGDQAEAGEGFMVMQIPEEIKNGRYAPGLDKWYSIMMLVFLIVFVVSSWLFFVMIRRRLLRLQTAMVFTGHEGLPQVVPPGKPDEIGRLEEAFNTMVTELKASLAREAEEETLRKRLVADLSHDLRTPLTVIRSHLHVLGKESLSPRGQSSLELMDQRIESLGILIENLLSYNLLSSGRTLLKLEQRDVLRLLRESAAAWYPVWEKEGFEVEIDLEGAPLYWDVDDSWFRRVMDNLFQNILRHARSGLYVGIFTEIRDGSRVIIISDQGGGLEKSSDSAGAGLGLSIVDLLLKRMELEWSMESTGQGTEVVIWKRTS